MALYVAPICGRVVDATCSAASQVRICDSQHIAHALKVRRTRVDLWNICADFVQFCGAVWSGR